MPGYEQVIDRLRRATVQVLSARGGGSGVVWDAGGTVVTNAHVAPGKYAEIIDASGRRKAARIVKRDRERDIAVLEVSSAGLEPPEIGDSEALRSGQIVFAVGHPFGITSAVAAGMIHAVGPLGFGARLNWIQADVRLAPGNSGGILADAAGRVIGINTMIFHGIGLAVPSNEVIRFLHADSARARAA
jgi:serine protease Do